MTGALVSSTEVKFELGTALRSHAGKFKDSHSSPQARPVPYKRTLAERTHSALACGCMHAQGREHGIVLVFIRKRRRENSKRGY